MLRMYRATRNRHASSINGSASPSWQGRASLFDGVKGAVDDVAEAQHVVLSPPLEEALQIQWVVLHARHGFLRSMTSASVGD